MKIILSAFLVLLTISFTLAQGCSDAGFCTLSAINAESKNDSTPTAKNTLKVGISAGATDYDVRILAPYVELSRLLTKNINAGIKLNGNYRTGPVTSVAHFSDAIITASYAVAQKHSLMAGVKLPFNSANLAFEGEYLPMAYQTSLGTVDIIAGWRMQSGNVTVSAAYQQPVEQNSNSFKPESTKNTELQNYARTTDYKRSGDILVRASYTHNLQGKAKRLKLTYSILPIYHLQNDRYSDSQGFEKEHANSQGLTLNLNLFANYELKKNSYIEFSTGAPVIARKFRPDGLSTFALTLEYGIKF